MSSRDCVYALLSRKTPPLLYITSSYISHNVFHIFQEFINHTSICFPHTLFFSNLELDC